MSKFCPKCGLESENEAGFCRGCGTDLRWVQRTPEEAPAYPPAPSPPPPPPPSPVIPPPSSPGMPPPMAGGFGHGFEGLPPTVPSNMVWAVLSTILCCVPLGIVAIVYAAQVNTLIFRGDIPGAMRASRMARNWVLVTVAMGLLLGLAYIVAVMKFGVGTMNLFRQ